MGQFTSVTRLSDARKTQLGHTIKADGRWRLFMFADATDTGQPEQPVALLYQYLTENTGSPLLRFTPNDFDIDDVFDCRAVFQFAHRKLSLETMPSLLLPAKGKYQLTDYEKIFCADTEHADNIFTARCINKTNGALLLIRQVSTWPIF